MPQYEHQQTSAAERWVVKHNLGKIPVAQVLDDEAKVVIADIRHVDVNTLEVEIDGPAITGSVICVA